MGKLCRVLALGAVASVLGACAPQFQIARGPGACSPMQSASYHRPSIHATMQKVHRLQARYSLSARYAAANVENWRGAATGECR